MPPTINIQSNATPFSTLHANVLEVFKRTDKTTELKRALNEAYKEMVSIVQPHKLADQIYQYCTIRQEDYALPDTIFRLNHPLRLIEPGSSNNSAMSGPLHFISKDDYDRLEPNPNAATINPGRPHSYCIYKNSILLTHIPDKEYTIEMNVGGEANLMEADADAMIFSPMWDEVVKAGALARLYLGITLKDEAENWMTIYRYGFTGDKDNITGGLGLLRQITHENEQAPIIVKPRDF